MVGALVQSGPSEHLVSTGLEVHRDAVRFQLRSLDILPPDKITLVVADKQCGFIHLALEGVGKFHVVIVHEAQPVLARGDGVIVDIVARGESRQRQRADRFD